MALLRRRVDDRHGRLDALDRSQAVIEFNLEGVIVAANKNFLSLMGYQLPCVSA